MLCVAVLDQRMGTRRAETAAECGELGRAQVLAPEHQHRMVSEGPLDPGEGALLERLRQVDAEDLGPQRGAERAELRCLGHGDPP